MKFKNEWPWFLAVSVLVATTFPFWASSANAEPTGPSARTYLILSGCEELTVEVSDVVPEGATLELTANGEPVPVNQPFWVPGNTRISLWLSIDGISTEIGDMEAPACSPDPAPTPTDTPTVTPTDTPTGTPTDTPTVVTRLAGADRFGTAAAVAARFNTTGTVFIATGSDFPDALAGGAAAGSMGAPLLLTSSKGIPSTVTEELKRLKPSQIVLLGGPAAVSDSGFEELKAFAGSVERLGGADRQQTAVTVSQEVFKSGADSVIVTSGRDFPDALSASSLFKSVNAPILLAGSAGLSTETKAEIKRLGANTAYVLGGIAAVSESVASELTDQGLKVVRLGGADRFQTSLLTGKHGFPATAKGATVYLATGLDFPDGLTVGPLAVREAGPVLLTNGTCISNDVAGYVKQIDPEQIVLVGGAKAISDAVGNLTECG